jgi:hypothetical protein
MQRLPTQPAIGITELLPHQPAEDEASDLIPSTPSLFRRPPRSLRPDQPSPSAVAGRGACLRRRYGCSYPASNRDEAPYGFYHQREHSMKKAQWIGACVCITLGAISGGANAGCLGGAAAGGVAGHFMHRHGLAGAAAGCAIGHYRSKHQAERANQGRTDQVAQTRTQSHHHWFRKG